MDFSQSASYLIGQVRVDKTHVQSAKAWFLDVRHTSVDSLVYTWMESLGERAVERVSAGQGDTRPLDDAAKNLSLQLAGRYALLDLLSGGFCYPVGGRQDWAPAVELHIGNTRGTRTLATLGISYPSDVHWPDTEYKKATISDGDLYLNAIGAETLHSGIEEALREATQCFRQDLFRLKFPA